MKLSDIMKTEVVTVDMDKPLKSISTILKEKNFHHVLVVDDGELCGVISERDLLRASSPFINTRSEQNRDLATLKRRAHQIMSRKPITLGPEADLEEAVGIMVNNHISCLPVLSSEGQLIGIVTWKDLLKAYSEYTCDCIAL